MPFLPGEFKTRLEKIEEKYRDWFKKYPPINEGTANSIHDHYYVYMSGSGHQLRFYATSNLPVEIRNEVKAAFEALVEAGDE